MIKTLVLLVLALAAVVTALVALQSRGLFNLDQLVGLPPGPSAGAPGTPSGATANSLGNSAAGLVHGAVTEVKTAVGSALGVTPPAGEASTHHPVPKIVDGGAPLDPHQRERYEAALDSVEIEGCNRNGTFSYQMRNERAPRTLRSGGSIRFYNGVVLDARMAGFPNCRITLSDGGRVVAELSSF